MKLQSTEFQSYGCTRTRSRVINQNEYPEGVNAPIQYGSGVKALVTLLRQNGCLSIEKIQILFSDLFSAPLNEATILLHKHTAHNRLEGEEQYIKEQLNARMVNHAGENGISVNGKNRWLHTLDDERFTTSSCIKNGVVMPASHTFPYYTITGDGLFTISIRTTSVLPKPQQYIALHISFKEDKKVNPSYQYYMSCE